MKSLTLALRVRVRRQRPQPMVMRVGQGIVHPPSITPRIDTITIKELLWGEAPGALTAAAAAVGNGGGLLQRDLPLDQGAGGKGPAAREEGRGGGGRREE